MEAFATIQAPFATLEALLRDFVRLPIRFDDGIVWSRQHAANAVDVVRESCRNAFSSETSMDRATITTDADTVEVSVQPIDLLGVEAEAPLRLRGRPLSSDTCRLDLMRDRSSKGADESAYLARLAERFKDLGEGSTRVPAWLTTYYDAVDRMNLDEVIACMAGHCALRAGNFPEAAGHEAIRAASMNLWAGLNSIAHNIVNVVEGGRDTAVEVITEYLTKRDEAIALRASCFFRREQDLITGVRFYLDGGPLHSGWSPAAH